MKKNKSITADQFEKLMRNSLNQLNYFLKHLAEAEKTGNLELINCYKHEVKEILDLFDEINLKHKTTY